MATASQTIQDNMNVNSELGGDSEEVNINYSEDDFHQQIDSNIPFEFTPGKRMNSELLYTINEKQLYRKDKKFGSRFYYRCKVVGSRTRLFYCNESNKCMRKTDTEHSHDEQSNEMRESQLRQAIKNDCSQQKKRCVSDIIAKNIRGTDLHVDLSKMKRSCYRYKSLDMPKSPHTAEELKKAFEVAANMERFGQSLVGVNEIASSFYRGTHIGDDFSYAVFASQRIIDCIEKNVIVCRRKYSMDGTFKICPYGEFMQLLIIYIEHLEATIPFIFILMNKKTEAIYKHVFHFIETNIFSLKCLQFMTDYEVAIRSALRSCYPESQIRTCWFHFCQACKRHASKISRFVVNLRKNDVALNIYCRALCLPLLPAAYIEIAFKNLATEAINCDEQLFQLFFRYFESQWIQKEGAQQISVYGLPSGTSNTLEAYNGALGQKIKKKGHLFKFVEELQEQEYIKRNELENLIRSGGASALQKRNRIRDTKIKMATEKLIQNAITPDEFLRSVTYQSTYMNNGLLAFEDVAVNNDEIIDILDQQTWRNSSSAEQPENRRPLSPTSSVRCQICFLGTKSIVLKPCGHLTMCQTCFDRLVADALAKPGPKKEKAKKKLLIRCPICMQDALVYMCVLDVYIS